MIKNLDKGVYSPQDLPRIIARFTDLMNNLATTGQSPLLKSIGMSKLESEEDLELLTLHESSARIEIAALKHYQFFISKGWNKYLAQAYAVRLIVDQICYGQYRNHKLRDMTVYELSISIAKSMRLFAENATYNSQMVSDVLLKGLKEKK